MVKKLGLMLFIFTLTASCSNTPLTSNQVKVGESVIVGGVSKDSRWNSQMILKRVSWYKDFSLLFDSNLWKVESNSDFLKWFSVKELDYINQCEQFYVAFFYNQDSDLISGNDFLNQITRQSIEFIELPQFKSNVKLHPHFIENSFQLYKVGGICQKSKNKIKISFPGYQELIIN